MPQPYLGEIKMFAGDFAPRGWEFCDGRLVPIDEYDALFSLLGTIYGGDGSTTFRLPDLRGRVPVHSGEGPGLPTVRLGQQGGAEDVTLTVDELPAHAHPFSASTDAADQSSPAGLVPGQSPSIDLYRESAPSVALADGALTEAGGDRSHPNVGPYLCVNFIIAASGLYPSRT